MQTFFIKIYFLDVEYDLTCEFYIGSSKKQGRCRLSLLLIISSNISKVCHSLFTIVILHDRKRISLLLNSTTWRISEFHLDVQFPYVPLEILQLHITNYSTYTLLYNTTSRIPPGAKEWLPSWHYIKHVKLNAILRQCYTQLQKKQEISQAKLCCSRRFVGDVIVFISFDRHAACFESYST